MKEEFFYEMIKPAPDSIGHWQLPEKEIKIRDEKSNQDQTSKHIFAELKSNKK